MPLEDVERIEVIRGPGGTIWGSNAVNGVINIITKNAKDTHGALTTASAGNADQGAGGVRYGGGHGSNLDYRAYVMGFGARRVITLTVTTMTIGKWGRPVFGQIQIPRLVIR